MTHHKVKKEETRYEAFLLQYQTNRLLKAVAFRGAAGVKRTHLQQLSHNHSSSGCVSKTAGSSKLIVTLYLMYCNSCIPLFDPCCVTQLLLIGFYTE